jgi:hypothetical protein
VSFKKVQIFNTLGEGGRNIAKFQGHSKHVNTHCGKLQIFEEAVAP